MSLSLTIVYLSMQAVPRNSVLWQHRYGLSNEQIQEAEADLEELLAANSIVDDKIAGSCLPLVDLMGEYTKLGLFSQHPVQ